MILATLILALVVVVGLMISGVVVLGRLQQRASDRANQLIPGRPSHAPRSWAGSHDPEAVLHRRLRDAMRALGAVSSLDVGSALMLRADLEQTALVLDDHLVAVAQLTPVHKEELLPTVTTMVESIETAVARYAAAATTPDTTALEADLSAVQRELDTATELQKRLES